MRLIHLSEVDSTSRYLRRLSDDPTGVPAGPLADRPAGPLEPWTVVVADRQTSGYGQHGRSWQSDAAGLYASVFLGAEVVSPVFTLLAGVAAIGACREVSGADGLGLKWVNDLVWSRRKIGGILTEVCHRKWLILGVGINLRPVDVADAGSLEEAAGRPVDRMALLTAFIGRLRDGIAIWQAQGNGHVVAAWLKESVTIGENVRVEVAGEVFSGLAVGINADGQLLLETSDGKRRTVVSGTVRLSDGSYA